MRKMEYNEYKRIQKLYLEERNIARAMYRITKHFGKIELFEVGQLMMYMDDMNPVCMIEETKALNILIKSEWITTEVMENPHISMKFETRDIYLIDNRNQ